MVWRAVALASFFTSHAVKADSAGEACAFARSQLRGVTGAALESREGAFDFGNRTYRGCIHVLKGDRAKVGDDPDPYRLFYPVAGSRHYREGWRAGGEADGPDGSSFRIRKAGAFCLVEEKRDGGDDGDPDYVPSPEFTITVRCAAMQQPGDQDRPGG